MSEREGSPEDFARLLGRDPDPAPEPVDEGLERVVDRTAPDVEERVETRAEARGPGEVEEPSHADVIAAAGRNPAKLERDRAFVELLHPTEDEER